MTEKDKKYLLYGGLALAGLTVYFVFFNNSEGGGNGVDPTGNGTVNPNTANNGGGTFNALKIATELYDAMKSTGYASWVSGNGDEADMILNALTPVSQSQFELVSKAFGKLKYNETFGNQIGVGTLSQRDLAFWLKTELGQTSEVYKTLKLKFPNYL